MFLTRQQISNNHAALPEAATLGHSRREILRSPAVFLPMTNAARSPRTHRFRLALWLCLLGPSIALGGCRAHDAAGAPTTLRIWYSTDDSVERAWSQQLARSFEASHPHVRVRLVDYTFEDLNTKLQLALAGGNPPDLAYVTPRGPGIPAYVAAHRLRDLTSQARSRAWASRLRPGLLAAYNHPFHAYGIPAGHVVAVPTALAAVAVLYNADLLHRLNLRVPRSLASFEAALARAKAAGYTPLGLGNADGWLGDDWYLTLVNATVPPFQLRSEAELSPSFSFRRPPFARAASTLQTWAGKGYFTPDFGGLDTQEGVDLFFRGRTLFQLVSSSENSQIVQDARQTHLRIGVFAFPRANGGTVMPFSGYEGWVVPAAAQHPDEATAFIDSLLSPPTARFLMRQGVLPGHAMVVIRERAGGSQASAFPERYLAALNASQPGVYLDAAPVSNLNATMEANVQLLLQGYEAPSFLVKSLQEVYASRGKRGSAARIDGEF